jgi:hypothetical protein
MKTGLRNIDLSGSDMPINDFVTMLAIQAYFTVGIQIGKRLGHPVVVFWFGDNKSEVKNVS